MTLTKGNTNKTSASAARCRPYVILVRHLSCKRKSATFASHVALCS